PWTSSSPTSWRSLARVETARARRRRCGGGGRSVRLSPTNRAAVVGSTVVSASLYGDRSGPLRALPAQSRAARGGDRRGEQVRRRGALTHRRDRPDAAAARDRAWD